MTNSTRWISTAFAAFLVTSFTGSAFADDKAACVEAASVGQTLRDQHRLLEAREQFRLCAREVCPAIVQSACIRWLEAAEKSLPTVVVTAKDAAGGDLVKVSVAVDGQQIATSLDGSAVPINPGAHVFKFTGPDGSVVEQQVVVVEGQHGRSVGAVFLTINAKAPDTLTPRARTLRTSGWIVGGLGVVGIVVGAVAGGIATSDKSSAQCNGNVCLTGPLDSAKTAAKVSDGGFIGGGVLLAGGVGLLLASLGRSRPAQTTGLLVAPVWARDAGGVAIGGSW
jgi:hypothetical protein